VSQPLFSVLVQSFNHAPWVEECLRSVLAQTDSRWELRVVDDGSTDGSPELLERLSRELGFAYRCQANQGLVRTINDMVAEAQGRYCVLLASDDVLPPDKLQVQGAWMESHPEIPATSGLVTTIGTDSRPLRSQLWSRIRPGSYEPETLFRFRALVPSMALLLRTDWLRAHPIPTHLRIEDYWLFLALAAEGHSLPVLPEVLCLYRIHPGNTHRDVHWMHREMVKVLEEFSHHPLFSEAMRAWERHTFSGLCADDKLAALRMLPRVFCLEPRFLARCLKLLVPGRLWHALRPS